MNNEDVATNISHYAIQSYELHTYEKEPGSNAFSYKREVGVFARETGREYPFFHTSTLSY